MGRISGMRKVAIGFLRDELIRLGGILSECDIFHPSGLKVHKTGDAITLGHVKDMTGLGFDYLLLQEPGVTPRDVERVLQTETVPVLDLRPGDQLAQDLKFSDEAPPVPAGTQIDQATWSSLNEANVGPIAIRRRNLEAGVLQARQYLSWHPLPEENSREEETRRTHLGAALRGRRILPLLVPECHVAVLVRDELSRSIILNTLLTAGHDAKAAGGLAEALEFSKERRLDALFIEGGNAVDLCLEIRKSDEFRSAAIIACAGSEDPEAIPRLLEAGANDTLSPPPRPSLILEQLLANVRAFGMVVSTPAFIRDELRKEVRQGGQFACSWQDPFHRTLPASRGAVLDIGGPGMSMEYGHPLAALPWAYVPSGVHPQHFLHPYAKRNASGASLLVTLPAPLAGMPPLEVSARIVYVIGGREFQRAGLEFRSVKGSISQYLSTARRQKS